MLLILWPEMVEAELQLHWEFSSAEVFKFARTRGGQSKFKNPKLVLACPDCLPRRSRPGIPVTGSKLPAAEPKRPAQKLCSSDERGVDGRRLAGEQMTNSVNWIWWIQCAMQVCANSVSVVNVVHWTKSRTAAGWTPLFGGRWLSVTLNECEE